MASPCCARPATGNTKSPTRPGRECRHNLAYWEGADYLGLGPSAWSTIGDRRWQNVPDTAAYVRAVQAGVRPLRNEEILPPATREAEKIAFGLRMNAGIDPARLTARRDLVTGLREEGLLEDHGPRGATDRTRTPSRRRDRRRVDVATPPGVLECGGKATAFHQIRQAPHRIRILAMAKSEQRL